MNKVILVTGASSGIGMATARLLAEAGNIVYGAARRTGRMEELVPFGVKLLSLDVTDEASMNAAVNALIEVEGRIDVLFNNAGFGAYGAFEDVPLADARYQMEVNVFGIARLTQLVLPHMIGQGYGKIINVSSIGGKIAMAFGSWYHASKFALEGLSDSLRNEVRQFGVDVILIEPGGIKSEWAGIAADNLKKTSGSGRYGDMASTYSASMANGLADAFESPDVIANLVQEAINAEQPEPRYSAGFMAAEVLAMRKELSDRELDHKLHERFHIK